MSVHQNHTDHAKSYRIPYQNVLNPAQLTAVTYGRGPILVIAGAGSGKTRTLTYRVARLVEDGVPPKAILLLSFTRKASQEMLRRAAHLLDRRCQEVAGGTFHSFANAVLRRHAAKIGFDGGFAIMDRSDAEDLIAMIRKEFSTSTDQHTLPRKSTLATIFSRSVNKGEALEEIIYEEYPHFGYQLDLINKIWKIYGKRKKELKLCDYDDLLIYLYNLLSSDDHVRAQLSAAYQHILVDEYQDTNQIQADIVSLLAGPDRNVMVVGDDSQSIYAFRGANFENIINFPQRFPGTHIIKLEQNYRSLQPILDLTNALIEQAAEKYSKKLFTQRGGGRLPQLVATTDENAQSRFVISEIARLHRQGVPLAQIAVLFRASFHAFDLELELTRGAIPFVKFGGFKFAESAHIKDVLAHLKIFVAPQDRISWQRILLLVEKIGPKSAQNIFETIRVQGLGPLGLLTAPLPPKTMARLKPLKELVAAIDAAPPSVARFGELVLNYYLPYLKEHYDDYPRRLRDLEQLLTIMERYERLNDFLDDMVLEPPNSSVDKGLSVNDTHVDRLTLSTVHSAKGLEWHTVFIIWALDGRFPSHHALDRSDALEEELRLMYVAATRSRENLFITYPAQIYDRATNSMLYRPSRYLEGIGDDLLEKRFYSPVED